MTAAAGDVESSPHAAHISRLRKANMGSSTLGGSSLTSSVRIQALTIHADSTRSIGGRLGGHFDSERNASAAGTSLSDFVHADHPPTEGTSLVSIPSMTILDEGGPPLTKWIFPALSCAAAYAFYNIFIKKGSATINPILGGVILQFVAALLGTALLAALVLGGDGTFKLHYDRDGLFWSVMAGLAVGLAEMLSFCVSGLGVPATQSIPIIIGGSVMFGAVLGLLMLGEKLMLHGWSGVALLVTGIACVALDPGEKVEEGGGGGDGAAAIPEDGPPIYWIAIALVCASAYAFYNIFIKKGSASINPILGGVVLQFVAALFGSTLLGAILIKDGGAGGLEYDHAGLIWSCMAGLAVGMAELLSFTVSGMGVQATQSIPIIIGGSVLFGAVLGLLMLGETMMVPGWIGVALLTTGIGMVATDPGEKVAGH
mmetsp:Transcript_11779/g.25518  ORF Transcript_11779/g.25518 Transcript_11779/m.25518 type:complete len:428 (+) Transcript_11779:166-1449(+)